MAAARRHLPPPGAALPPRSRAPPPPRPGRTSAGRGRPRAPPWRSGTAASGRTPWSGCSACTSVTTGRERLVVAVNGDALRLTAELLKVFVREAAARAARQAQAEDVENVNIEHVEKVLPQLLLDF
ncbi:centromere protein X isoform X1 [Anas acuta]|uniref:centromere protein X isoform X1 n=1 Tax=Anas acuta TaxID=28680 RepID=UPI0035C87F37